MSLFNRLTYPTIFDPASCDQLAGLMHANEQINFLWNSVGVFTPILLSAFAAAINGGAEVDFDFGGTRTLDRRHLLRTPDVRASATGDATARAAAG